MNGNAEHEKAGEPRPAVLPRPTYWPAVLALAVCFALWGILTSVWMIVPGVVVAAGACVGWFRELRDEDDE